MTTKEVEALKEKADAGSSDAQYELGMWCLSESSEGQVDSGKEYLTKAAKNENVDAQLVLGDIQIKHLCAPIETYKSGVMWYERAAANGSAHACVRLGILHFNGLGVEQSDTTAFGWFKKAAMLGSASMMCDLAYLYARGIGVVQDVVEANKWYLKAAINKEPRAFYNLGLNFAFGVGVQENFMTACVLLEHAADKSYPGSKSTLNNLLLALSDSDHQEKVILSKQLIEVMKQKDSAYFSFDKASAEESETSFSPRVEEISSRPRVVKIHGFLSQDEADHLVDVAIRMKSDCESSVNKATGDVLDTSFTGHTTLLDMSNYDAIICTIERRIAEATNLPLDHGEWLSMLGYSGEQRYHPHVDYFLVDQESGKALHDFVGQRLITFLMYLNDVEAGGETCYPDAGIQVSPEKGMAVMHYNCLPDGSVDPLTVHTALPVTSGVKWIARKAICEKSLYREVK